MATITLPEVQEKVREILVASAGIAPESVLVDTGNINQTLEDALATRGVGIVVGPIRMVRQVDQTMAAAIGDAELEVEFWENPPTNAAGANKNPLALANAAAVALLSWQPDPGDRPFTLGSPALDLVADDPGLRAYAMPVSKFVHFR